MQKILARTAKGCDEELAALKRKSQRCVMYVCACGEVTWRMDVVDVESAMELLLELAVWCYDVIMGGTIWRC